MKEGTRAKYYYAHALVSPEHTTPKRVVHVRIRMMPVHKIVCTDPLCALKPIVIYELSQPCKPCGPRELTVVLTCLRIRLRRISTTASILKACLDV
jgi:hypothetical protein